MNLGACVFLCDRTGNMAKPWAAAGYECWCVDIQHSIRRDRTERIGAGLIHYVWGDARAWRPPEGIRFSFAAAFPFCTHDAVSGARDFEKKGGYMLRDGLEMFEAARQCCAWSGAPYIVEHPVSVLASIPHIGKPGFYFHPNEYAGYLADPSAEAYTKKTAGWIGNGFVIPPLRPVEPVLGSMMHLMPPSEERSNDRSATPMGFAIAAFLANAPHLKRAAA